MLQSIWTECHFVFLKRKSEVRRTNAKHRSCKCAYGNQLNLDIMSYIWWKLGKSWTLWRENIILSLHIYFRQRNVWIVKQHLIYLTSLRYRKGSQKLSIPHNHKNGNTSVDIQPYQFYFHVVDKVSGTFIHFAIGKPLKGICGKGGILDPSSPSIKSWDSPIEIHQNHESQFRVALQAIQISFYRVCPIAPFFWNPFGRLLI